MEKSGKESWKIFVKGKRVNKKLEKGGKNKFFEKGKYEWEKITEGK